MLLRSMDHICASVKKRRMEHAVAPSYHTGLIRANREMRPFGAETSIKSTRILAGAIIVRAILFRPQLLCRISPAKQGLRS